MLLKGRQRETSYIDGLLASGQAEFLAIYGRRRVGKTFLIREYLKAYLAFELTGMLDAPLADQLVNFQSALKAAGATDAALPDSWQQAFAQLTDFLLTLPKDSKQVVFLDELPWLAGRKSKFLPALDHFWNTFLSRHPQFILIVCGSAASWMISKLIHHKGGLHNRVTARLRLEPFTLAETEIFLKSRNVSLTRYDVLTLTMAFGGVPFYLREAKPGRSAAQIIDEACFSPIGLLREEFSRLYASLFDHPERHLELVRLLARHPQGLDRGKLTAVHSSGGGLTRTLEELSEAAFITPVKPFGKKTKETIYRLSDEYSLFYLRWIENHRGDGDFLSLQNSPAWRAWSGYALESLAHRHIPQIKRALGIGGVQTTHSSWLHRADETWPQGSQIDLLIDRADNTINLFEIKFSQGPFTITKPYADELRRKLETFKAVTGTRKNVFLTFLTTHGLTANAYAAELAHQSLTTDCLFEP
ncbi:MAG: ATP-binding protein [Verrucomicrobiota bacterium]